MPDHRPPAPITSVYVIYSADILGSSREIDSMDPTQSTGPYPVPTFPELRQTEDDGQYEYGYLGNETGRARYYPAGAFDAEGIETVDNIDPADPRADSDDYGEGRHRKWAGELTIDRWREFADRYLIDLDDDGVPVRYEETMGSLTELGHLDAVAVDNTEGWSPTDVIDSQFYVSFALADSPAAID